MNIETAQRLYEYRKANGYSQEELAEKIGVSRQAISKWERSESSPDTDNLIALAKLYEVTIDELLNGTGKPEKAQEKEQQQNFEESSENKTEDKEEPKVNYTNGAHIYNDDNNKDNVHIGWDGIHVESKNGDKVHVGGNGVHVESNGQKHTYKPPKNPWLHALLPSFAVLFYLLVGFTTHRGWAVGWIVFLLIPIIESAVTAFKSKNPSAFAYPVFATAIFLTLGMLFNFWHPSWIIFITIPIYYVLCDAYKKSKYGDIPPNESTGTYYSPNAANTNGKRSKSNTVSAIIISIICGITIVCVVAIISVFGFLEHGVASFVPELFSYIDNDALNYEDGGLYSVGAAEVPTDSITEISVEWVSGNINVEYYDGETISFSETEPKNENYAMRYRVDGNELKIKFCKSGILSHNNYGKSSYGKDLTLYIPRDLSLIELDIDGVSSTVNVNEIAANTVNCDTVSGNVTATGSFSEADFDSVSGNINLTSYEAPHTVSVDTISGDCKIAVPEDISGFTIDYETVSGSVTGNDFYINGGVTIGEGSQVYGDGLTNIDFESVSGSLEISKAA